MPLSHPDCSKSLPFGFGRHSPKKHTNCEPKRGSRGRSTHNPPSLKLTWRSPSTENICCGKHVLDEFIKLSFATKKHKNRKRVLPDFELCASLWQKFGSHTTENTEVAQRRAVSRLFVRRLLLGAAKPNLHCCDIAQRALRSFTQFCWMR